MDLVPDPELLDLQRTVRAVSAELLPPERLLELAADDGWCEEAWRTYADLGLFALRVPESEGGLGLGAVAAALVFEELGRALAPGPLLTTHLAHTHAAATGAPLTSVLGDDPELVPHAEHARAVVRVEPGGVRSWTVEELDVAPVGRPLDPLTPVHRVVATRSPGAELAGPREAAAWSRDEALLVAAQQVGIGQAVLDLTVAHAGRREQFGTVIGRHQAVKHRLADLLVHVTLARAAVVVAAVGVDEGAEPAMTARAVSSARVLAERASVEGALTAVQLHGAMGFAWETGVHLFLKRAWVLQLQGGIRSQHLDTLSGAVGVR